MSCEATDYAALLARVAVLEASIRDLRDSQDNWSHTDIDVWCRTTLADPSPLVAAVGELITLDLREHAIRNGNLEAAICAFFKDRPFVDTTPLLGKIVLEKRDVLDKLQQLAPGLWP